MSEKEELDVQETRRILGPNSYNDNSDLVNYTSELRDRDGGFFALVDFNADDVGKIRESSHCLEYEIHILKPRILKRDEIKPPDYDQFIQCHECGNVFPIYETHFEPKIKDPVQTTENPFENESIFQSTDSKATQSIKGKKRKSRFKIGEHEDPDIQAAIDKGLAVKILYDSSQI